MEADLAALGSVLLIIVLIGILWSILPLIICYSLAKRKGRSRGLWVLLAIVFGWIAVLVLAVVPPER